MARVLDDTGVGPDPELDGAALLCRRVSWVQPLLDTLREWLPRVEVVAPDEARAAWRRPLDAIAARHGRVGSP